MIPGFQIFTPKQFLLQKRKVHKIVQAVKEEFNFNVESLLINFVSDKDIHAINLEYLKHDYVTDIITFDYSETENLLDVEIYISFETAEENAKKFKVSHDLEIIRLVIHGLLHCLGYDDQTVSEKRKMTRKENELVDKCKKYSKDLIIK